MNNRKRHIHSIPAFAILIVMVLFSSCRKDNLLEETQTTTVDTGTYPDWSAETHGILTEPNYDEVFAQPGEAPAIVTVYTPPPGGNSAVICKRPGTGVENSAESGIPFTEISGASVPFPAPVQSSIRF